MRQKNGVKKRLDGQGDGWANMHREKLERWHHMQDIDAFMGLQIFAANSGEKFFMEYVPDDYRNHENELRKFAVVAMFDRKRTMDYALSDGNRVTRQFYTWLCRSFADIQPIAPKFFYAIGDESPPWLMLEMDIDNPTKVLNEYSLTNANWKEIWQIAGLAEIRQSLNDWIKK